MAESVAAPSQLQAIEERVLEIVRGLAAELGGGRASRAATAQASLERDVGLGSLEKVELLLRLEAAFGRALDDRYLALDTPSALARLLAESGSTEIASVPQQATKIAAAQSLESAATIHEALWRRAQADPDRPQTYMREDDGSETVLSYGALLDLAQRVAGGLRERGVARGDTVALMLPTGSDFLACFQGILIAGAVPVPIYPPVRLDRIEEYAVRQSAILADAGVGLLITIDRARPIAALLRPRVSSLRDVVTPRELRDSGARCATLEGAPSDAAFIQYTSGSTGAPKGVLLTHANLLANIAAIRAGLDARPTDVGASWLPLYHDMGLIGSWLFCLHEGFPIDIQSPLAFLARPERWLWAIHRRRATLSAAPNFAYELCVRKIKDEALEGLDLSSWRCALNGAEPVNPDTLERFARRFAPYGFRREALMPVYGLAENSVGLCFPPVERGPRIDSIERLAFEAERRAVPASPSDTRALRFVAVGPPLPEHEVRILDDSGADLPERSVGRLVFRGPSATSAYFNKSEATAAMTLPGGWLDSGDLAYRADGEIHITGRLKDLIIKAGRNMVPQEIEEAAAGADGIRRGCVVAFGAADAALGTEILVVVAETRATDAATRERIEAAIIERVAATVGVPPDVVMLVPPGAVPKTSSGKIRRSETRQAYLVGSLARAPGVSFLRRARITLGAAWGLAHPALHSVSRALYALYLGIVLLLIAVPVWILAALLPGRRALFALARWASRLALRVGGCRIEAEGLPSVEGRGPHLFASNHASYLDVLVLMALLPIDFVFVAKKEVASWPLVGLFVRRLGHVTVDRWDSQQGAADASRVARALEQDVSVLVFPEGTFTAATGLRPFRLGAFKTAVDTGVPIVPLALRGTRRILRGGSWLPRPGRATLWRGAPIAAEGDGFSGAVRLRDRVAETIAAHCGEPRLDLVAGGPERP
jgi:1-acyl-sn-glycerol-3-phosphate acyltransferase